MKISNEKPVGLQEQKSDYTSLDFHKVLDRHISSSNVNKGENSEKINSVTKSEKELNKLAKEINKFADDKNISLIFSSDKDTGKNVIRFVNQQTKEVIKQVPSEEMLKIAQQIDNFLKKHSKSFPPGFLLNERV